MGGSIEPGWYTDPQGDAQTLRWWNGDEWTRHTRSLSELQGDADDEGTVRLDQTGSQSAQIDEDEPSTVRIDPPSTPIGDQPSTVRINPSGTHQPRPTEQPASPPPEDDEPSTERTDPPAAPTRHPPGTVRTAPTGIPARDEDDEPTPQPDRHDT